MTTQNARTVIDMLLATMFCQRGPDRHRHSFMYNDPGKPHFGSGGAGFEVNYENRGLMRAALFARRHAAPHLRSLSVGDVAKAMTDFITENFGIIGWEAWEGCGVGDGRERDAPFADFVSDTTKASLAAAILASDLFSEPRKLFAFPLVVVSVDVEFDCPAFFFCKPEGLTALRLPPGYNDLEIRPESFPPFARWDGTRQSPQAWLGIWAGTAEVAKRNRAAVLGAVALLPHRLERYQFSRREMFGGFASFSDQMSMISSDPHTPALGENVVLRVGDEPWLSLLAAKIVSEEKTDRRQMRALEYYYRAWAPDPTRRFPTLFGALDAIYGDAGQATKSIIDAVGPVMGDQYGFDRLKLLLSVRGSVVHGGAPNVYESGAYHRYFERYEEDATRDLDLIVARCLQAVIFGSSMNERPHTYAALYKERTGYDIR